MSPWEELLSTISAWQFVLWIAGALVGLGAVVKLWPFVRNAVQIVDALLELPGFIKDSTEHQKVLTETVADIKHQVFPNGGGSLSDDVHAVKVQIIEVKQTLTAHIEKTEKI